MFKYEFINIAEMTKATKKKHVVQELMYGEEDRLPAENERIVRIIAGRGSNLHEVEEIGKAGESFLVSMPSKFRKTVWVKRGDCLIVMDIPEGDKVKAEITEILTRKRINALKKLGVWPETEEEIASDGSEDEFVNKNRRVITQRDSDSSSEED